MLYQRNLLQVFSCFNMDATKWAYLKRSKYQERGPLSLAYQNVDYMLWILLECVKISCFFFFFLIPRVASSWVWFFIWKQMEEGCYCCCARLTCCFSATSNINILLNGADVQTVALFHRLGALTCMKAFQACETGTDCSSVNTLAVVITWWILLNLLMWRHLSTDLHK